MPQASGVALGFDRLVMLAAGAPRIDQVVWTPPAGQMTDQCIHRIDDVDARTLRTPAQLVASTGSRLPDAAPTLERVAAALCRRGDAGHGRADRHATIPNDPIARQFIPSVGRTGRRSQDENADPIGDHAHSPVEGIVHRYPDRVLFKLVHVCAVYCRFCFRREMVGPGKETRAVGRRLSQRDRLYPQRITKSGK